MVSSTSVQEAARVEPHAADRIRKERERQRRVIGVLDDDPTGSQTVHDVDVISSLEPGCFADAFSSPSATCFALTNTRSMDEGTARRVTDAFARALHAEASGRQLDLISRGDSTLRGHVIAEVDQLQTLSRELHGVGYDAVLFVPAFFEAGRFTRDDTHYATIDGTPVPVGDTEFARDHSFGYSSSNLRDFLQEVSHGAVQATEVASISLEAIRLGGVERVARTLCAAQDGQFVVVNALEYADLDVVALAVLVAQSLGRRFLFRTAPSFVRSLAGISSRAPLTADDVCPNRSDGTHGLVAVGSHVDLSNRQVAAAARACSLQPIELDVAQLLDTERRATHIEHVTTRVVNELGSNDVIVQTSRSVHLGRSTESNLEVAGLVSSALTDVVRGARIANPAWVVAKGGITSHDIATKSLEIRRARVLGQLFPGMVTAMQPTHAPRDVIGKIYISFAGNVGDDHTLTKVISSLRGQSCSTTGS